MQHQALLLYEQVFWGQCTHRLYVQLCIQTNRVQREVGNFLQRCECFGEGKQRGTRERHLPPANTSAIGHCTLRQATHLERRGRVDEGGKRSQRERRERQRVVTEGAPATPRRSPSCSPTVIDRHRSVSRRQSSTGTGGTSAVRVVRPLSASSGPPQGKDMRRPSRGLRRLATMASCPVFPMSHPGKGRRLVPSAGVEGRSHSTRGGHIWRSDGGLRSSAATHGAASRKTRCT